MPTREEYAQLSARVYRRGDANRVPIPDGWTEISWLPDRASGFSAGVYAKGSEVVIAFTGTNETQWTDFKMANIPLAIGSPSEQLRQAVVLYEQTRQAVAADPNTASLSFTGHSLGGGLASLMAVYFNKPATIFAPAPFGFSTLSGAVLNDVNQTLQQNAFNDPDFAAYLAAYRALTGPAEYERRRQAITTWRLRGEILENLYLP